MSIKELSQRIRNSFQFSYSFLQGVNKRPCFMVLFRHGYKIFKPIIISDSVKMMYNMIIGQTAKFVCPYFNMFPDIPITHGSRIFWIINHHITKGIIVFTAIPCIRFFSNIYFVVTGFAKLTLRLFLAAAIWANMLLSVWLPSAFTTYCVTWSNILTTKGTQLCFTIISWINHRFFASWANSLIVNSWAKLFATSRTLSYWSSITHLKSPIVSFIKLYHLLGTNIYMAIRSI